MKRPSTYLILICLSYSQLSNAQYNPTSNPPYQPPKPVTQTYNPSTYSPTPPPQNIQVGDQFYDGSISGLRNFIDEEYKFSTSASSQKIYHKLNTELEAMESSNTWSLVSLIAGSGAGAALVLIGSAKDCTAGRDLLEGEDPNCVTSKNAFMYGGLALVASGTILYYILKPSREDILNFINKHNKLNNSKPIKWQIGFTPSGSSGITATYEF